MKIQNRNIDIVGAIHESPLQEGIQIMSGFSARNLKYMRTFTEVWSDRTIVQVVLAQIPEIKQKNDKYEQ